MSEVTNPNTDQGFDRRAVVKGAVWSVPVIAAAVAAPAAAASSRTATVTASGSSAQTIVRLGGNARNVQGTGTTSFTIANDSGPIVGPITGTVTISPLAAGAKKNPGIAIRTVTSPSGTVTASNTTVTTTTTNTANSITSIFAITGNIASSGTLTGTLNYGYEFVSPGNVSPTVSTLPLTYSGSLRLTDFNGVQIGQLVAITVTTSFAP